MDIYVPEVNRNQQKARTHAADGAMRDLSGGQPVMERTVDVVHADRAYTSAVRIKEGGGRAPRYWVPFNYGRTKYAWPLGSGAVLAIGDRGEIAVYDLAGGTTTMRAETNSTASAFLSSDEARLYVYTSCKSGPSTH